MRTPQLRRFPSPNGRGISAVVLLTTVGLTLAAQVAGAQTTAGSSVAPLNEVRAASRHQARQLAAKDVLRARRHHAENVQHRTLDDRFRSRERG